MKKNLRIAQAVATLCEAFNRTATPAMFSAYQIGLLGISDESVERAVALALQRCKFMPVPAEIREIAMTGGGSYESAAERAFNVLAKAVRDHGPDRSVNFEDGAINAAVRRLGGWQSCCDQSRAEFDKWYSKRFLSTYVAILKEGASESECRYHVGRMEMQNAGWEGRTMRGGGVYNAEQCGAGVRSIGGAYQPALPAPPVQPSRSISAVANAAGLELKLIGRRAS